MYIDIFFFVYTGRKVKEILPFLSHKSMARLQMYGFIYLSINLISV